MFGKGKVTLEGFGEVARREIWRNLRKKKNKEGGGKEREAERAVALQSAQHDKGGKKNLWVDTKGERHGGHDDKRKCQTTYQATKKKLKRLYLQKGPPRGDARPSLHQGEEGKKKINLNHHFACGCDGRKRRNRQ